jgi:type IV pilus assembly protein PilO
MALIPQEKPKQIALMVGIASLAILYGVYEYWYSPRVEEVTTLTGRLTNLQDRNRTAQVTAARGGADLEARVAAYERHVARLEELIPRGEEVPALLTSLNQEARRNGVAVVETTPLQAEPGQYYTRRSYDLAVVGPYHGVGRFITGVASLPRIVTPLDMEIVAETGGEIEPASDAGFPVRARFRIETYVLDGRAPPDSTAAAGGGA